MPGLVKTVVVLLYALLLSHFNGCNGNTAGIETTNGESVTVAVADSSVSGTAPAFAKISVFDTAYMPLADTGIGFATTADKSGAYQMSGLPPGDYTLIAETRDRKQAALFNNVQVSPGNTAPERVKLLEAVGVISGTIQSELDSLTGILVFLRGTGYFQVLVQPGPFEIREVPPGQYIVHATPLLPGGLPITPRKATKWDSKSVDLPASGRISVDILLVK